MVEKQIIVVAAIYGFVECKTTPRLSISYLLNILDVT
jgi:hypothetical protein